MRCVKRGPEGMQTVIPTFQGSWELPEDIVAL